MYLRHICRVHHQMRLALVRHPLTRPSPPFRGRGDNYCQHSSETVNSRARAATSEAVSMVAEGSLS